MRSHAEANVLLEAQRASMSGAVHLAREVEPWRDATPVERLAAMTALCRDVVVWLERMSDEERARATAPQPLPADAVPVLERLRAGR